MSGCMWILLEGMIAVVLLGVPAGIFLEWFERVGRDKLFTYIQRKP